MVMLLTITMITSVFGLGRREVIEQTPQEEIEGDLEGDVTTRDDRAEQARDEFVESDDDEYDPDREATTRDEIFLEALEEESGQ